jgi:SMC interacting uncharacterized protein involved in chromosome segregation
MAKLLRFMMSRNAVVNLSSPLSRRDFATAATVVLATIDASIQITEKNIDEEYPKLLNLFKFPTTFVKSWLKSSSSAPMVLSSLVWLIDNTLHVDGVFESANDSLLLDRLSTTGLSGADSGLSDVNTLAMFRLSCNGYERWLLGASDQVAALDPQLAESISAQREDAERARDAIERRNAELEAEIAAAKSGADELPRLTALRDDLRSDRAKLEEYLGSLDKMVGKLAPRLAEGAKQARQLQNELSDLDALIEASRNTVSQQAVKPADADMMRQSIEKLARQEAEKALMREKSEAKVAEAQEEIAAKLRDVEALAGEFNSILDRLDLADGHDAAGPNGEPLLAIKVNINPSPSTHTDFTSVDLATGVVPVLAHYAAELERRTQASKRACDDLDADEADADAALQRRSATLEALKGRLANARERLAGKQSETAAALKRISDQVQTLGAENAQLGNGKSEEAAAAKDQLETLQRAWRELERAQEAERGRLNAELCEATDLAASHLTCMQAMLEETEKHAISVTKNLEM